MSINKEKPHLVILPEDDANRQLANGFLRCYFVSPVIRILPVAGGWTKVLEQFEKEEIAGLEKFKERFMVLLIDFDEDVTRLDYAKSLVPANLSGRVFVLGVFSRPESLRKELALTYERIGEAVARDCYNRTDLIWGHAQLQHNRDEAARLNTAVHGVLFPRP